MTLSKRAAVAVLCLIVVALPVAAAPSGRLASGVATLQPCGDEPSAAGTARLNQTGWGGPYGAFPFGTFSVRCTGLTPGATYAVLLPSMLPCAGTAGSRGTVVIKGDFWAKPTEFQVYRTDATANVLVLSGPVVWSR
jgi:hypothetical protein